MYLFYQTVSYFLKRTNEILRGSNIDIAHYHHIPLYFYCPFSHPSFCFTRYFIDVQQEEYKITVKTSKILQSAHIGGSITCSFSVKIQEDNKDRNY